MRPIRLNPRQPAEKGRPEGDAAKTALLGRVLCGKWRLDRLIRAGGMSAVYSATHRNGKPVAIKVLRADLAADARTKQRFLREGRLANGVTHEGVVAVLDDDETADGLVFLVMDLLRGASLDELDPMVREPNEVAFMMDQLLDILGAAHATGIVHRDIKPSNVFLTTRGRIRLLDFGVARIQEGPGALFCTGDGAILGTPAYMAPEQARGRWSEVDYRTDIWAVGATMFRLLSGRAVHDAETGQELMIAAATQPAPRLSTLKPDVPSSLAALVERALRFDRGERWQDVVAMRDALQDVRRTLPPYEWPGLQLDEESTLDHSMEVPEDESTPRLSHELRSIGDSRGTQAVTRVVPLALMTILVVGSISLRWWSTDVPRTVPPDSNQGQGFAGRERTASAMTPPQASSAPPATVADPTVRELPSTRPMAFAPTPTARARQHVARSTFTRILPSATNVAPLQPTAESAPSLPPPDATAKVPLEAFLDERK